MVERRSQINFVCPQELKLEFRKWCLDRDMSIKDALTAYIEQCLQEESGESHEEILIDFLRALIEEKPLTNCQILKVAKILRTDSAAVMGLKYDGSPTPTD
jgi:hypothetical protein